METPGSSGDDGGSREGTCGAVHSFELLRERPLWALLVLVTLYWREALTTHTVYFRDLYQLFYPKRLLLAEALSHGRLPLWDPMTNGGQPFLATPSNTFFYPTNLLFLLLDPVAALNVSIVLQYLLAAIAMYWLVRKLGMPPVAAFASGAVFAFSGVSLSTGNLLPLLLALPWVPLTLGCVHLYLLNGQRRWRTLSALFGSMPLLSAAVELTAMMFVTIVVWVLFHRYPGAPLRRRLTTVGFAAAFAVALALCQVVPATEVIANSSRSEKALYETFSKWSVDPRRLPETLIPSFFGQIDHLDDRDYWGRGLESSGFPYILSVYFGSLALLLAGMASFATHDPGVPRRALFTLTLAGAVLSLGASLPYFHFLWRWMPFFTIFRFPVKMMLITIVPVSLLAGWAVAELRLLNEKWRNFVSVASTVALISAMAAIAVFMGSTQTQRLLASYFRNVLEASHRASLGMSLIHCATIAAAAALIVGLVRDPSRRSGLIAALLAADLMLAGKPSTPLAPRAFYAEPAAAELTRRVTGPGRFYHGPDPTALDLRAPSNDLMWLSRWKIEELSGYTSTIWGIPSTMHVDYDGLAPRRITQLRTMLETVPWTRRLRALQAAGVTAFMTTEELLADGVELISVLKTIEAHPVRLYRLPRTRMARFVSTAYSYPVDDLALKSLFRGLPYDSIALTAPARGGRGCGSADATTVSRSSEASSYEVVAPCDGWVVLAENDYPGWKTTVDGLPANVVRADYAFVAIPVTKGRHLINRIYEPRLSRLGIAGFLVSLCALALSHGWREHRNEVEPGDCAVENPIL